MQGVAALLVNLMPGVFPLGNVVALMVGLHWIPCKLLNDAVASKENGVRLWYVPLKTPLVIWLETELNTGMVLSLNEFINGPNE